MVSINGFSSSTIELTQLEYSKKMELANLAVDDLAWSGVQILELGPFGGKISQHSENTTIFHTILELFFCFDGYSRPFPLLPDNPAPKLAIIRKRHANFEAKIKPIILASNFSGYISHPLSARI